MEELTHIWGVHENITPLEIAARAFVMFFIALLLIRISGMRAFGMSTAFDTIITFLVGGILVRGVIAATPFISCIVAALVLVIIHRLFSLIAIDSKFIGNMVKGKTYLLYKDGKFLKENMAKTGITENDIMEDLRIEVQLNSLEKIDKVYLERCGKVSFVQKGK